MIYLLQHKGIIVIDNPLPFIKVHWILIIKKIIHLITNKYII